MVGSVMVVGGGIAGMQASLDLADSGFKVYLVDKKPTIGGVMAQLDKTFPTLDCSMCIMAPKLVTTGRHHNITLLTNADIKDVEGEPGNFTVTVRVRPRYVNAEKCTGCGICAENCLVEAVSAYDEGLTPRSVIYVDYPQAVPLVFVIDREKCIGCGLCESFCQADAIEYDQTERVEKVNVGAIILAAGFDEFEPEIKKEYGYKRFKNVVTSIEFERILSASGPFGGHVVRPSDGETPEKIAFLQCVGSRDEHTNKYCSAVCCMYATKEAIIAKEHNPDLEPTIFFMDMRTYGKGFEQFYNR
ncbi:MAG: CoB--CoM heterodisulfide reductase iron-sulfur subunit A family protein, partial [Theionarchaea archaeon]|nr:CoB--CoM heterodisulfide reductase iron-sulfur subunit A family protein [Theionarchaea archaeon]